MSAPPAVRRGGRRGRRTGAMVRVARERVAGLFALAEREAATGHTVLAHRYVVLARRIGMRYNVRLLAEYRELYCRRCSEYWVEGRTVRTRLRGGRRVRTCLTCGKERRALAGLRTGPRASADWGGPRPSSRPEAALAVPLSEEENGEFSDDETEEP